jgi:MFS family permease
MSIDIGAAFSDGVDEFLSKKGGALAGIFFLVSILSSLAGGSLILAVANTLEGRPDVRPEMIEQIRSQAQFGLEIGIGPSIALLVGLGLVAELARVVAIRALADQSANALRPQHYSNGLLKLFLYRVLATIVVLVLYGVLLLVMFAPAIVFAPAALLSILIGVPVLLYVAIALYFAPIAVVVDESGPLDAISDVWSHAKGNRLNLVAIAIGVFIVSFVISAPNLLFSGVTDAGQLGADAITASPVAVVATGVFGSLSAVFTLAVATSTYLQLSFDGDDTRDAGGSANADQFGTETEF